MKKAILVQDFYDCGSFGCCSSTASMPAPYGGALTAYAVMIPRFQFLRLATCTVYRRTSSLANCLPDRYQRWSKEMTYAQQCTPQGAQRERGDCMAIRVIASSLCEDF